MIPIDSTIADRYHHHQYLLEDTMIDNTLVENRRIEHRNDIRPPTVHRNDIRPLTVHRNTVHHDQRPHHHNN